MDTSDSECFESADEEIGEESPPQTGSYKNLNSLNIKKDLIPSSRNVYSEENKFPDDHVRDAIIKDNIGYLSKDNNNSLPFCQNVKLDTSNTLNLLKQDDEKYRDISNVSAPKNEQRNEADHVTAKDTRKELSKATETKVFTDKNQLTKEVAFNNLKNEELEDNENIWEDDWSKEAQTEDNTKKEMDCSNTKKGEYNKNVWDDDWAKGQDVDVNTKKDNTYGNLNREKLLKDNKDQWENDWSKEDEIEVDTRKSLLSKGDSSKKEILSEDSKDIWEDDWGQWESVSNEKLENKPKTLESISASPESKIKSNGSWGDWGSWGVTSLLSTATSSVSTITNQVTQGISNVLESGIGIPNPEELAKMSKEEKQHFNKNLTDNFRNDNVPAIVDNQEQPKAFNFETLLTGVTQITKLVESTSNKVISGGLDTLETIGKKTMEVLQEGDPGLKKKRAFLRIDSEKINLSQVLREAKEKSQEENKEKKTNTKKVNYEILFDDHHGLVHLEALEMLSKQCNIKLKSIFESSSGEDLVELQETLDQIQELCELPEDDDEQLNTEEVIQRLEACISELGILISYDKLISVWKDAEGWMKNTLNRSCKDIHEKAIDTLAQVTAVAVEQFHKSAELLLIKQHRSTADEADSLVQITIILTSFLGYIAFEFCKAMTNEEMGNTDAKDQITNIYLEAANSSSYIKDAFKLLIPVVEVGAL